MRKILKFGATWCNPCKQMDKVLDSMGTLAFPVEKLDIDENTELAVKYGIRSVPTLVMVDENGNRVSVLGGLKTQFDIEKWIQSNP